MRCLHPIAAVGKIKEAGRSAGDGADRLDQDTYNPAQQAADSVKGQAQQAKQGGQGLMGWAFNSAGDAARGVGRTAGSAFTSASNAATRAGDTFHLPCCESVAEATDHGILVKAN